MMSEKAFFSVCVAFALTAFPIAAAGVEPAYNPDPHDGATGVEPNASLSWSPGEGVDSHHVFFGTDFDDVNTGELDAWKGVVIAPPYTYSTGPLSLDKTYYWRIEEVNETDHSYAPGQTWSFTVADRLVLDNMESYNDANNFVFDTWIDGLGDIYGAGGNGTGSSVYLAVDPCKPVHSVAKSMQYHYDNCVTWWQDRCCCYSEACRTFEEPQNWTDNDEKALVLWFYGHADNNSSQMWVKLSDDANEAISVYGVLGDNPNDIKKEEWTDWNIDLRDFSDAGVDLSNAVSIAIGFGDSCYESDGGIGVVYFDDIGIYPVRCVPKYGPHFSDLNRDCAVDWADVELIILNWLADER